jgi:hypothetical protein
MSIITKKMSCKGICIRHKAANHYANEQKCCQVCDLFIKWNGLCCPCCGYILRTRPRKNIKKANLREAKRIVILTPSIGRGI